MTTVILSGCAKEIESTANPEGEKVLARLMLTGEVTGEETTLTKAFTSGDLLGIQVKEGSNYYAYGLFDDISEISLYLNHGKTYSFECTLVKNGKSIVNHYSGGWNKIKVGTELWRGDGSGYALPFIHGPKGSSGYVQTGYGAQATKWNYSATANLTSITNSFIYSSSAYFLRLQYGQVSNGDSPKYSKAIVYYGAISGILAGNSISVPIEMKNGSFGVTLSVKGITDGDVRITIKNSLQTFHTNSGITQDTQFGTTMWSFFDLKSAWKYADNYSENFTVGVVWNRGVGVTQDLGSKTVQFKRNTVNHVNINLGVSTKSAGIAIEVGEPEIINETYNIGN